MKSIAMVMLLAFTPSWGTGELNRSPWHLSETQSYAIYHDLNTPYVRIGDDTGWIAEGWHQPLDAPARAVPRGAEGAALRRLRRYTAHGPRERIHLAYGVYANEARAWVTIADARTERLVFRGRADRRDLLVLAEYAYAYAVRDHAERTWASGAARLPRRYFR